MLSIVLLLVWFIANKCTAYGMTLDEAFQIAGCVAKCHTVPCQNDCRSNLNSIEDLERLSTAANFNGSLHCKDVDVLTLVHNQGLYVIDQRSSNSSRSDVIMVHGNISTFDDLYPGEQYQYHAYKITEKGISQPETTPWFMTTKMNSQPMPVKSIAVKNIWPEQDTGQYLQAEVAFEPAEDRSCTYDILSWSEEEGLMSHIPNVNALNFQVHLHQLGYLQNNTVIITARNRGSSQSNNVTFNFITPSCVDIHKNLTICPPNKVEGFRLSKRCTHGSKCNFSITWNSPELIPNRYEIQIVKMAEPMTAPDIITVPGNLTEALYSVEKGHSYAIAIVAESEGGISPSVTIYGSLHLKSLNLSILPSAIDGMMIIIPSGVVIIVLISIAYIFYRRRKAQRLASQYKYCANLKQESNLNPLYETPLKSPDVENTENAPLMLKDHFEIRPAQLRIQHILGSGISGVVRLGSLQINEKKTIKVAVKMLKDYPNADDLRNFQQEISIMKAAGTHPNIVSIIGCCALDTYRPILVVEYCSKGDLQSYLRHTWKNIIMNISQCRQALRISTGNKEAVSNQLYDFEADCCQQELLTLADEEITATDLLNFARQIANGMEFLSSSRIVHSDLAARNVLVCANRTIKISDFGLSRDIYCLNVYKKQGDGKLPLKWMAIEALTHQIYTTQSDVWSFGILLWEIVTLGSDPYPETPTNMILQCLKSGYRMPRPSNCGEELYALMTACWRTSPRSRPTFTELKKTLDKLLESISHHEYLNLDDLVHEFKK